MSRKLILGEMLRVASRDEVPNNEGCFRLWLTTSQIQKLFKKDAEWLLEHLAAGHGDLEGYHQLYEEENRWIGTRLATSVFHAFYDLEYLESDYYYPLRKALSTLVSGDHLDATGADTMLDKVIFEIIILAHPDDAGEIKARREGLCLPLQLNVGVKDPHLKKFRFRMSQKFLAAKRKGVEQVLAKLPPRPFPSAIWHSELGIWGAPPNWDSANRFKGVDDPDF